MTSTIETPSAPATLALRHVQHKGQLLGETWICPADAQVLAVSQVLADLGLVDDALFGSLQQCRFKRSGSNLQPIWALVNGGGHDLLCNVNQRVLPLGQQLRLDDDDWVEIGLTRFQVCLRLDADFTVNASAQVGTGQAPDAAVQAADTFDLMSLAHIPGDTSLVVPRTETKEKSDFGDLIAMEPLQAPNQSESDAQVNLDPLEALHAQYLKKIRNPSAPDELGLWADIARSGHTAQADEMERIIRDANNQSHLDDLLGQSYSIKNIFQNLDSMASQDLLQPESFSSVMHLFAPDDLRHAEPGSLESIVVRSLPGLSRREHHNLSLDSAMPTLGVVKAAPAASDNSELSK